MTTKRVEVSDYRLAGFLKARGVPYSGTKREGRICFFLFDGDEGIDALIDSFAGSPEVKYDVECQSLCAIARTRRPKK